MFQPLVSILTPTYEHGAYLRECLESIVAQSYPHWEQIVVDDGSDEALGEIVRSVADPRIRYERQAHVGLEGLGRTYDRALSLARGEVIAILEGDDRWHPDHLATLVPLLEERDVVLAYGVTALLSNRDVLGTTIPDDRFRRRFGTAALHNDPVGSATCAMLHRKGLTFTFPCATLIRREALVTSGGFRQLPGFGLVDYPTFLALSLRGRFAHADRVVAYWRRHPASSSSLQHARMLRSVCKHAYAFALNHGRQLAIHPERLRRAKRSWVGLDALIAFHEGRVALVNREWRRARHHFASGFKTREPLIALAAFGGYVAAWLRQDLEPFISFSGRQDVRLTTKQGEVDAQGSRTEEGSQQGLAYDRSNIDAERSRTEGRPRG